MPQRSIHLCMLVVLLSPSHTPLPSCILLITLSSLLCLIVFREVRPLFHSVGPLVLAAHHTLACKGFADDLWMCSFIWEYPFIVWVVPMRIRPLNGVMSVLGCPSRAAEARRIAATPPTPLLTVSTFKERKNSSPVRHEETGAVRML